MSVATQITRLQGVRDQIRTKMVDLGLSSNTDLLQDLADDLDGVSKISPTNSDTTDPGTGYTNVDTLSRSISTRYIKVPKGYNDTNRKFTISGVADGAYSASVSSHTTTNASASSSVTGSITNVASTTKPSGTDGTSYYTITPKLTTGAGSSKATGKATIDTAGYLATGNTTSTESSKTVGVTATQGSSFYLKKGSYSASVSSHTTSNATASSNVSGSIVNITSATKPTTGTDGADYFTITPKLTTGAGSSKATGKATIGTSGYLAVGNTTSEESSKSVGVTASQGGNYYLKASSVTKEDPGTSYANKATVTPSTSTQYVKVTAGYLPNSKITVDAIPNQKTSDDVVVRVLAGIASSSLIGASQATDGVTVTATATGSTTVPAGYYSTQIVKDAAVSESSTTIKPRLAGTNGSIELTAGTSAFTKTSVADYSNGFITSVKVNPTPSETKEFTPTIAGGTVSPTPGSLLSSVTVEGVPHSPITLNSQGWKSDSNVTIGKYYYDVYGTMFTASNNLYVMPDDASAAQSFGVYAYSQSKESGASLGTLQFRAMIQPTSNLTYTLYYLS